MTTALFHPKAIKLAREKVQLPDYLTAGDARLHVRTGASVTL